MTGEERKGEGNLLSTVQAEGDTTDVAVRDDLDLAMRRNYIRLHDLAEQPSGAGHGRASAARRARVLVQGLGAAW